MGVCLKLLIGAAKYPGNTWEQEISQASFFCTGALNCRITCKQLLNTGCSVVRAQTGFWGSGLCPNVATDCLCDLGQVVSQAHKIGQV